jgi:hypothetical protein
MRWAETRRFPNPHRDGCYGYSIEALVTLGVNEWHSLSSMYRTFKRVAGSDWFTWWCEREPRNEYGKDATGRFLDNLWILQRTGNYGRKLLEVGTKVLGTEGCVIDFARDRKGLRVRLNTNSSKPLQDWATKSEALALARKSLDPSTPGIARNG